MSEIINKNRQISFDFQNTFPKQEGVMLADNVLGKIKHINLHQILKEEYNDIDIIVFSKRLRTTFNIIKENNVNVGISLHFGLIEYLKWLMNTEDKGILNLLSDLIEVAIFFKFNEKDRQDNKKGLLSDKYLMIIIGKLSTIINFYDLDNNSNVELKNSAGELLNVKGFSFSEWEGAINNKKLDLNDFILNRLNDNRNN